MWLIHIEIQYSRWLFSISMKNACNAIKCFSLHAFNSNWLSSFENNERYRSTTPTLTSRHNLSILWLWTLFPVTTARTPTPENCISFNISKFQIHFNIFLNFNLFGLSCILQPARFPLLCHILSVPVADSSFEYVQNGFTFVVGICYIRRHNHVWLFSIYNSAICYNIRTSNFKILKYLINLWLPSMCHK